MNLDAIRIQLRQALSTLDGWEIYEYVPQTPKVPCIVILPDEPFITYHGTMSTGGVSELRFMLTALVGLGTNWSGQSSLNQILSSGTGAETSVIDLLEARDSSGAQLQGTVASVMVDWASEMTVRPGLPDAPLLGTDIHIVINTPRT